MLTNWLLQETVYRRFNHVPIGVYFNYSPPLPPSLTMYVGPWQEYRLGQLFNEQTKLLASAVRSQIQQQIQLEQAQTRQQQPQLQLPQHQKAKQYGSKPSSYSASLKNPNHTRDASIIPTNRSDTSSVLTPGSSGSSVSYESSQRTPSLRTPTTGSQLNTPTSLHSSSQSVLPPLASVARAAVNQMQASRVRATVTHPLAHLVSTYYPEALISPTNSTASHRSHQSSAAELEALHQQAQQQSAYLNGGNPAMQYRPPPQALPRPKKRTQAQTVSHKEHMKRLRSLYGLQGGAGAKSPNAEESKDATPSPSSELSSVASSTTPSPHHSLQGTMTLPKIPGVVIPAVDIYSLKSTNGGPVGSASSSSTTANVHPPLAAVQAAPLPTLTKQTIAMYGPLPSEIQDSLHFYAHPSSHAGGAPAPLPVIDDAPTPPPPPVDTLAWLKDAAPIPTRGDSDSEHEEEALQATANKGWLTGLKQQEKVVPSEPAKPVISLNQYGTAMYEHQVIPSATSPTSQLSDNGNGRGSVDLPRIGRTSITPTEMLRPPSNLAQHLSSDVIDRLQSLTIQRNTHFEKKDLERAIEDDTYALIESDAVGLSQFENNHKFRELGQLLDAEGYPFRPVIRCQQGHLTQHAYIVLNTEEAQLRKFRRILFQLGKQFKQDSIIISTGGQVQLVFTSGSNMGRVCSGRGFKKSSTGSLGRNYCVIRCDCPLHNNPCSCWSLQQQCLVLGEFNIDRHHLPSEILDEFKGLVPAAAASSYSPMLTSSASQAGLLSGKSFHLPPGSLTTFGASTKLSAEARLMAGLDGPHHTQTTHSSAAANRTGLQSSHGSSNRSFSESGDFEDEVNELLGWTETITDELSPHHSSNMQRLHG